MLVQEIFFSSFYLHELLKLKTAFFNVIQDRSKFLADEKSMQSLEQTQVVKKGNFLYFNHACLMFVYTAHKNYK